MRKDMSDEFITLLCVNRQTDNIFYALVNKPIANMHTPETPEHKHIWIYGVYATRSISKIETNERANEKNIV